MQSFSFYFKNNKILLSVLLINFHYFFPEKLYLKLLFKLNVGYCLNLKKPTTFNEKLQWLKIHDRNSRYTELVDKYEVKRQIETLLGKAYVIPTLGVWDKLDSIDWNSLPNQFVLKTTHGSGGKGVVICKDKKNFNKEDAIRKLSYSLKKSNTFSHYREWPYKNIKKRIIAEQLLSIEGDSVDDYKFFCFNGIVKFFKVDFGRFTDHHANYYDTNLNILPFGEKICPPDFNHHIQFPSNIDKMFEIATKLSKGLKFVRVDLYNIQNNIYFGELTFYPASGLGAFTEEKYDYLIGELLTI